MKTNGAGQLRHLLALQAPGPVEGATAQDALGQPISTPTTVLTRHGAIEPLSGRELDWARQISPDVTHKVTVRYCSRLDPGNKSGGDGVLKLSPSAYQWVYQGRVFGIESVVCEEERRRWMTCLCKEKQAVS